MNGTKGFFLADGTPNIRLRRLVDWTGLAAGIRRLHKTYNRIGCVSGGRCYLLKNPNTPIFRTWWQGIAREIGAPKQLLKYFSVENYQITSVRTANAQYSLGTVPESSFGGGRRNTKHACLCSFVVVLLLLFFLFTFLTVKFNAFRGRTKCTRTGYCTNTTDGIILGWTVVSVRFTVENLTRHSRNQHMLGKYDIYSRQP